MTYAMVLIGSSIYWIWSWIDGILVIAGKKTDKQGRPLK